MKCRSGSWPTFVMQLFGARLGPPLKTVNVTSGTWERNGQVVVEFLVVQSQKARLQLLPVNDVAVVLVREELDGGHYVCNG